MAKDPAAIKKIVHTRRPRVETLPLILHRPPPRSYGSVFAFNRFLKNGYSAIETLHRSDSMVSLCFRSIVNYITEDNLVGLQNFVENKKVQVDDKDENGTTPLMVAASKGKLPFVRELINHGADVNAEDADNWSALLCAAKEGYTNICLELLDHGADIEHRDMGGWTALMWATYKGHAETVSMLLDRGAEPNAHGNYHISSLLWAAGRGYAAIARDLIRHGAKVNVGDKYGTTALVWASRKGNAEIVDCLLKAGANVDTAGMYSWTPLLVATLGNHVDVVNLLLEHRPNVNALDKDGCTALTIACKEGYNEIAVSLLNVGAYINIQDRAGDTNLIHAVKSGHRSVVEALLKKYADVDIPGKDRKTAIYSAVEKGNVGIVKLLLSANPDLEIATKDGDTPLLRAVRTRNVEIVQLLLDKKAKVAAADKKGDTALHIAMRARSKAVVEVLLRNPKNSQLLYRPNRAGETAYNIDMSHQKTILGQIFGARRLNTNEDNENMLGYDLYSSALADILSEPCLSMPITVGLYAKWGSGKSFLLNKLRDEMKNFARQWVDQIFQFSSSMLLLILVHVALIAGVIIGLVSRSWIAGLSSGGGIVILSYTFLFVVWFASKRYDMYWPYNFNVYLTHKLKSLKLLLQVMFCHPPGASWNDGLTAQPIRFYFTDQTRVSSTAGGENSVVQMLGSLYDSIENDYGSFTTRLYRAFRPKPLKSTSSWRWRRLCCVPNALSFVLCFLFLLAGICVLTIYLMDMGNTEEAAIEKTTAEIILGTIALLLCFALVSNFYTWSQMFLAILFSQRRHLQRAISRLDTLKSEGFLQALRSEVNLMTDMVKCLDSFTSQQTRLVVIVDGLDSCEQDKVLLVLDAVHMLFSDNSSPFIVILAIDPHIISKAVEVNSRRLLSESNIGGHDYLRNMVHLPFYLQNSGLLKAKVSHQSAYHHRKSMSTWNDNEESVTLAATSALTSASANRRLSTESGMSSSEKLKPPTRKGSRKLKLSESVASSLGSNLNRVGGAQDVTKMLLSDDYFSDINPRSMRRLMNVIYVTGRLLKAFQIDFNWYHLASWINITEQWPYRTSWIIFQYEMCEENYDDNTSLKSIYDKLKSVIPMSKEVEPLLELDRDEKKFDVFLTFHRNNLSIGDLRLFLPFTINLDPYIKKVIKEETQNLEETGGLSFTAPVHPAAAHIGMPPPTSPWPTSKSSFLRRNRQLSRTSTLQSPGMLYSQPSVIGWPQQWMSMPETMVPMPRPSLYSQPSILANFSSDLLEVRLSVLSVDGVCDLLNKIEDLNSSASPKYMQLIRENNINGRVLLNCDLDELKKVLQMNFGDWELFRMLVLSLKEREFSLSFHDEDLGLKNVRFSVPSPQNVQQPQEKKAPSIKSSNQSEKEKPSSSRPDSIRSSNKQSIMEKQVTLEEQIICGALQTLNEEACEDVMEETGTTRFKVPSGELDIHRASSECTGSISDINQLTSSSPLHQSWTPVTISIDSDCGSNSSTPLQSRSSREREAVVINTKPPPHPSKFDNGNKGSLHSLLQDTALSRSVGSVSSGNSHSSKSKGETSNSHQHRPSSLRIGDIVAYVPEQVGSPQSPKHHITFRSHSADEKNYETQPSSSSLMTNLTNSLFSKKQNIALKDGRGSLSLSPSVNVTPNSSLEKLNRLKDKILRSVPLSSNNMLQYEKTFATHHSDTRITIDSDDESTPLVSEISTPGSINPLNTPSSQFLNQGFALATFGSASNSTSSEGSPSSVKSTPISPPEDFSNITDKEEVVDVGHVEYDNKNDALSVDDIIGSESCLSSSCGSSVSLSQMLEPTSNFYHLVNVSRSVSSVTSSSHEHLTDQGVRRKSSFSRQDALESFIMIRDQKDCDNPETTV